MSRQTSGIEQPAAVAAEPVSDRYHGFALRSVTWGYREIFSRAIEELFAEGRLGPERAEVTAKFFSLLKQADQTCFDHVLQQFLGALNPANRWIMDLPGVFTDLVDLGASLARVRLYYGIRFFETLAAGGLGGTPEQVRNCLNCLRRLRETDDELAMAFLAGHAKLSARLRPHELERYIAVGLDIHRNNPAAGCSFMRGELSSSETYILNLTQECRLGDAAGALQKLLLALTARQFEVADLGELDSDDLIDRGTMALTLAGHLYLPARCRHFPTAAANRNWYVLCTLIAAAMLTEESFPCIHGHPEYRTCAGLVGEDPERLSLYVILEYTRVLRRAAKRWPGARRLFAWGLAAEANNPDGRAAGFASFLLENLDDKAPAPGAWHRLRAAADASVNCFDSAARLDDPWGRELLAACPAAGGWAQTPLACISDFVFPVNFADAPADKLIADLKNAAAKRHGGNAEPDPASAGAETAGAGDGEKAADEKQDDAAAATPAFVYDEWDFQQNDYRRAWCHLREFRGEPVSGTNRMPQDDWQEQARRVRGIFERIRPEMAWREKRLADGDDINADLLLTHLVERRLEPELSARFYEKPVVRRRDLAVLILLDVSGSTGESLGGAQVLDVEKQAAVIFGQGLAVLGDSFAVCGFSSNGRENCDFLRFKDFAETWGGDAMARILAAWPRSSTRIGPALRHAGQLLAGQSARQRLIILVTDGKPMDQDYDPQTRYAQHDVRMACEENARRQIHTFAISTEENSLADMEIMFPRRRFVILPRIAQLPRILPQLYLRLTA